MDIFYGAAVLCCLLLWGDDPKLVVDKAMDKSVVCFGFWNEYMLLIKTINKTCIHNAESPPIDVPFL